MNTWYRIKLKHSVGTKTSNSTVTTISHEMLVQDIALGKEMQQNPKELRMAEIPTLKT